MADDIEARVVEVLALYLYGDERHAAHVASVLRAAGLLADHTYCNERVDRADERTDAARVELAEEKAERLSMERERNHAVVRAEKAEAEVERLRGVCNDWGSNYKSWVDATEKAEAEVRRMEDWWRTQRDRARKAKAALEAMTAERDELESRLSMLMCDLTGGKLSKTGYDVRTMVQAVEAEFEDYYRREGAHQRGRIDGARQVLAAVDLYSDGHFDPECGCLACEVIYAAREALARIEEEK